MATHLDLEEQEQIDQIKHFWNTWGTLITSVLLVILLALAGYNGYQYWQNRQAMQAAALADAVQAAVTDKDGARIKQVFDDLRSSYGGTQQAGLAGLAAGKAQVELGQLDAAKSTLTWVAEQARDPGHKALGRLRLASLLMQEKAYDDALKQLSAAFPPEFDAVAADRRGDILALQDKKTEAIAQYRRAYQSFDEGIDYRRIVEYKLAALGAEAVASKESAQ